MWRRTRGETRASVSRGTDSPRASNPSVRSPILTVFQASAAFGSRLRALTLFMISAQATLRNAPWFAKKSRRASWCRDSPRFSWRCRRFVVGDPEGLLECGALVGHSVPSETQTVEIGNTCGSKNEAGRLRPRFSLPASASCQSSSLRAAIALYWDRDYEIR